MSDEQKPTRGGLAGMALRQARKDDAPKPTVDWTHIELPDLASATERIKARFDKLIEEKIIECPSLPPVADGNYTITFGGLGATAARLQELRAKIESPETWRAAIDDWLQKIDDSPMLPSDEDQP